MLHHSGVDVIMINCRGDGGTRATNRGKQTRRQEDKEERRRGGNKKYKEAWIFKKNASSVIQSRQKCNIFHIWACFCQYDLSGTLFLSFFHFFFKGFDFFPADSLANTMLRLFLIHFTPRIYFESPAGIICGHKVCSSQQQYWRGRKQQQKNIYSHCVS